jgi:flagellin
MSLGVLNNLSAIYAENNLNNTSNSLSKTLQQLSSGSKINSGADDAAGLSLVNGLQANSQALAQSKTNATEGVGLLQVADGALSQVTSLLNRAVTLATEASNGTLNSSQDAAANQEYQSILSEITNIGSTTTFNQNQVFNTNTAIYTGDSTSSGASINALNIRSLSASNVGDTGGTMAYNTGANGTNVFIDLSNDGSNATVNDSLGLSTATTAVQVSYLQTGASGAITPTSATITVGNGTNYANTVQGLMNAINGSGLGLTATFGTAAQAGGGAQATANAALYGGGTSSDTGIIISGQGVGTGTSAGQIGSLTTTGTALDQLAGTMTVTDTKGANHTITLGQANSTDTLTNLAATINAAGYGITAAVNTTGTPGTILTFTSASSTAAVNGSSLTDDVTAVDGTAPTSTTTGIKGNVAGSIGTFVLNNATDIITGGTLTLTGQGGVAAAGITLGVAGVTDNLTNLAKTINNNAAAGTAGYTGLSASVSSGTLTITSAGGGAAGATTAVALSSGTSDTLAATPTSFKLAATPTTNLNSASTIGTLALSGGAVTDTLNGTLTIGGSATHANATITLGGLGTTDTLQDIAKTINAGNYGITATYNQSIKNIVFTSSNSSMTLAYTAGTGAPSGDQTTATATVAYTAANPVTTAESFYKIGISSSGGIKDWATTVVDGSTTTYGGTANTGMTSDLTGSTGIATMSYMDSAGTDLSKTDLTSQANAEAALTSLNAAISNVAAQDGYIGAMINTLNSVSSVLGTQSENVTSAQNAVQATDYASAASNMSKYEILSQTGISALAQANSMQQEVTKLLQ